MKKLHLGTMSYGQDSFDEVAHQLAAAYGAGPGTTSLPPSHHCLIPPLHKAKVRPLADLSLFL